MATASDSTHILVSEVFESVQGEGPSTGVPCTVLRLAGCNLRCSFCDTPYSWDFHHFDQRRETTTEPIESLVARVVCSTHPLLVVTGGEPLLQQNALAPLFAGLPDVLEIEVETNGTIVPSAALCRRVTRWNVSPKLTNSGEAMDRRWNLEALRVLRDTERAWLKFVVATPRDLEEVDTCFRMWGWRRDRVILMPLASTRAQLAKRAPWVVEACIRRDWRYSTRLQVEVWEGERGV